MATHLLEDRDLALKLYQVLSEIDPGRWRDEMAEGLKARLEDISGWLEKEGRHAELQAALSSALASLRLPEPQLRSRWLAIKRQLQPAYQALANRLRASRVHVPALRPTNYARSLFHASAAVAALVVIRLTNDPQLLLFIALGWAGFTWSCEIARRLDPRINTVLMRFFKPIAHAHEAIRVNSATWYATALVLLAFTYSIPLCLAAVAVLGFADPMAGLIGRRFGRVRLIHGRSLEGTLAFLVTGTLVTGVTLQLLVPQLGVTGAWAMAFAASLLGAIAELVSVRFDDNFTIPTSAAVGAAGAALLLGLPL